MKKLERKDTYGKQHRICITVNHGEDAGETEQAGGEGEFYLKCFGLISAQMAVLSKE